MIAATQYILDLIRLQGTEEEEEEALFHHAEKLLKFTVLFFV